jgi:phosphoribosylanthranilate isomerase
MRVKVCGITQEEQMIKLPETGATFAGLIFYPKSPRYVLRQMTTSQIKKETNVNKVGVFVNASIEEVLYMVDECRLHMVQLHGDETPRYCEKIADYISVVKAFRISDSDNIAWRIKDYMDGTGKKFDWNKLHGVEVGKPYFLSGGIEPGDIEKLKAFSKLPEAKALFAIDINSKFELVPGIKDMEKIKKFIQQL